MTPTEKEPRFINLLPHQAAFVDTFFSRKIKRINLLRSDVGLGKTTAVVALVHRLMKERPTARTLFLVPGALRSQIMDMLNSQGIPSLLVDRYRFREMLDTNTGGDFWPRGAVVVLSLDFAKQPDIRESLAGACWDLVIADEAHSMRGARAEALQKVGASAERVILVTTTSYGIEAPDAFPLEDVTVVEWRRDQVVDHDGKPLDSVARLMLHEVPFSFSRAELSLRASVGGLCEILGGATGGKDLRTTVLHRTLESSPAALEGALQRLTEGLKSQESVDALLEASGEEVPEDRRPWQLDRATSEKVTEIVARALQEIEAIGVDSKLGAFAGLLSGLSEAKMPLRRICVLTQYLGTLYYLAAEIEDRGMKCLLLHGGMRVEDRQRALTLFSSGVGILVGTVAGMKGIELGDVTDLVLYDVPDTKAPLYAVLTRFRWFGRRSQLTVYVLTPSNSSDASVSKSIALLHDLLAQDAKLEPGE